MSQNKYGIGDEVVAFEGRKRKAIAFTVKAIRDIGRDKNPKIQYAVAAFRPIWYHEKDLTPYAQADY